MEDEKIKDIFKEFDPELSSSFQFITKLQKNMEAMEIVRQYNETQKRRNKWAVAIAGICGFAMGVIMTLLLPFITDWVASISFALSLPPTLNFTYIVWLLIATVSVLTTVSVYEVALKSITLRQELS